VETEPINDSSDDDFEPSQPPRPRRLRRLLVWVAGGMLAVGGLLVAAAAYQPEFSSARLPPGGPLAGHDVATDPVGVRRALGYVSATTGVPDRLAPREILATYGSMHGFDGSALRERIDVLLDVLGLAGVADRPCGRLSSGQRQRVSLGRALVHDPPALVLDEPTSALDVVGSRDLMAFLERLRAEGRAILVSTHRLHEIERRCDRFVIIDAGRIVAQGTREQLGAGREGGLEDAFFAAIGPGAVP